MFSRTVKCPICRKNTDLPPGGVKRLPDNFLVANLTEVISRRKNHGKSPQCEICQPGTHASRTAVSKCLDCSKLLCANCLDMHKKTKATIFLSFTFKSMNLSHHKSQVMHYPLWTHSDGARGDNTPTPPLPRTPFSQPHPHHTPPLIPHHICLQLVTVTSSSKPLFLCMLY